MTNTWELIELADKMGLTGAEFRVWYEERMEREREQRAAEREARKEQLERETQAKKEQLELETREKEKQLELETRAKKEQLELENQNLQLRLRLAEAENSRVETRTVDSAPGSAQERSERVVEVCSDSSYVTSDLNLCQADPVPPHDLSLESETRQAYDREVGSEETKRLEELVEARECFVSMEQERSIQSKGCVKTCEKSSTLHAEVGLSLKSSIEGAIKHLANAGECRNESSDLVSAFCFGPLDVATGATYTAFHDEYNSPIQREGLSSREIVDDAFMSKLEQNAEKLEEQRVELQCKSALRGNEDRHDDSGRGVQSFDERARQKAEVMEAEHAGSNGPATHCTRKDADWCSLASSVEEVASLKVSERLSAYELKQGVPGKHEVIQTWLYWRTLRQRFRLAYIHSSVYACDLEVGRLVIRSFRFRRAYGRQFFHRRRIPHSCQLVRATKHFVWDAIT